MSKILLATAILAAYGAATTHEQKDAVLAQVIESVKEQEDVNATALETDTANVTAIAKLQDTVAGLNAKAVEDEKSFAEANQTIADLGKQLDVQAKSPGSILLVSHKGKNYKIIGNNFITSKGKLDAEALSKDKELIATMVENGS